MPVTDTIAAVSTAPGEGGIGIIRISGPGALETGLGVFALKAKDALRERCLYYGDIVDASGNTIDNGFFVYMKGPRSYTGEDVVELHCHGGPLILKKTLEAALKRGARLAEPGEFTRHAFLNGKLDLAQAESVIDVIRAETEASLAAARGRLEGAFSARVDEIKEMVLGLVTRFEAELDFEEDEIEGLPGEAALKALDEAGSLLKRLLSTYEEGRTLKEGVRVLILGRPNVGKSSLLNILLREERAIVTEAPGTTRDVIEETVNIRGIPVRLMDTAGLRETEDRVEAIGIRAARGRIESSGLILFVVDSTGCSEEDLEIIRSLGDKRILVIANKSDIADNPDEIADFFKGFGVAHISALKSSGIEELKDRIYEEVMGRACGRGVLAPGELLVSARHKALLEEALEGVERARGAVAAGLAREFAATDLRSSLDKLGGITGETTTEDILERIFSEFCIGK